MNCSEAAEGNKEQCRRLLAHFFSALSQHEFARTSSAFAVTLLTHPHSMPRRRRPPRPGALADLAPLRILTQIVTLQISYYAVALVLIIFTTIVAGRHPDAGLLLDWHNLRGDVTTGWTLGLCWLLDSLITYVTDILKAGELC